MADRIKPRRRIEIDLKIGADDWRELRGILRHLETEIAMHERLSNTVSGGYGSGFVMSVDEDESITHDSWAAELERYLGRERP